MVREKVAQTCTVSAACRLYACTELLQAALPFIEALAPENAVAAAVRDRALAWFDKQSKPLRDAVEEWARAHGVGCTNVWCERKRLWRFAIGAHTVEVSEDGAQAWIDGQCVTQTRAPTPRMMKVRLTQWVLKRLLA